MVGDDRWTNYVVDFDEKIGSEMAVCVHAIDLGSMYCLHIYLSSTWWFLYKDNNERPIPDTNIFYFNTSGHVKITVQDNQISSSTAGRDVGTIWDSNFQKGGVAIYVQDYTTIDNFKITWLP